LSVNNHRLTITKESFDAVIFDLDGVITKTAKIHAAAWKELFDNFLQQRAKRQGKEFKPFDMDQDYRRYVDGKPRYDGVKSFLESRGIKLPNGDSEDDPDEETIHALGSKKNKLFHKHLKADGVEVYEHAPDFLQKLRQSGFKTAIISASKNCTPILEIVGLLKQFDTKVDGVESEQFGLKGKPDPAIFLEAARRLGVEPKRAVVLEDAIAGVQAGSRGGFGLVIGVDRTGHARELEANGADLTVQGLGEIEVVGSSDEGREKITSALEQLGEIFQQCLGKQLAVFLDYDGTLTPIVSRPEDAVLDREVRQTLKELADQCFVAVISGRDLKDVQNLVGLGDIYYAGSHGFDIAGPRGQHLEYQLGKEFLPALDKAEKSLRDRLEKKITGVQVERKKFSIAVHYRRAARGTVREVEEAVDQAKKESDRLRKSSGKKIFELQPDIDWHKGKALLWLLEQLGIDRPEVIPFYVGDDVTDEDAFKVLKDRGIGIAVQEAPAPTAARYRLRNPDEVQQFLKALITYAEDTHRE
jgi:trehalose 6-phosphate phosphatase